MRKPDQNGFWAQYRILTLIIQAFNDQWFAAEPISRLRNESFLLLLPQAGGHVGFHDAEHDVSWHDCCAAQNFSAY